MLHFKGFHHILKTQIRCRSAEIMNYKPRQSDPFFIEQKSTIEIYFKDFGGKVVERAFRAEVLETSQKVDEMTSLHCGVSAPVLVLGFELPCRIPALLSWCKAAS